MIQVKKDLTRKSFLNLNMTKEKHFSYLWKQYLQKVLMKLKKKLTLLKNLPGITNEDCKEFTESLDEVKKGFPEMKEGMKGDDAENFEEADLNKDGILDFSEFSEALMEFLKGAPEIHESITELFKDLNEGVDEIIKSGKKVTSTGYTSD